MAEHWDYLRVYVDSFEEIPVVLEAVVQPWLAEHSHRVERWFFIRYFDSTGIHLRLRIQPRDPWSQLCGDLEERLWAWCAAVTVDDSRCVRFVLRRHYAPEYGKFGGAIGVELAHRVSHLGSAAAVRLLAQRDRVPVLALGAGHLAAMSEVFADLLTSTFMYQYAWYWTGRGTIGDGWARVLATTRERPEQVRFDAVRAVDVARRVLQDEHTGPILREYSSAVREQVEDVSSDRWRRPVSLLVHDHMHLMNNRLGVLPLQEAHLARMLYIGRRLHEEHEEAVAKRAGPHRSDLQQSHPHDQYDRCHLQAVTAASGG